MHLTNALRLDEVLFFVATHELDHLIVQSAKMIHIGISLIVY